MLEPLLLNVSRSLEVLLGLRDVHASLLWKFVAAERMSPVQCGLWWTLSGVWVLLLEDSLLPILFVAFLRLHWQLSWLFRAPLRHHAFEIRGITKKVKSNKNLPRGWRRNVNLKKIDLLGRVGLFKFLLFYDLYWLLVELNIADTDSWHNCLFFFRIHLYFYF